MLFTEGHGRESVGNTVFAGPQVLKQVWFLEPAGIWTWWGEA